MVEVKTRLPGHLIDAGRSLRVGVHPESVDHLLRGLPAAVLDAAGWSVLAQALRSRPRIDRDALGNADVLARHLLWLRDADAELAQVIALTHPGRPTRRRGTRPAAPVPVVAAQLLGEATWDGITQVRRQLNAPALAQAGQLVTDLIERACYLATRFGTEHQLTDLDPRPTGGAGQRDDNPPPVGPQADRRGPGRRRPPGATAEHPGRPPRHRPAGPDPAPQPAIPLAEQENPMTTSRRTFRPITADVAACSDWAVRTLAAAAVAEVGLTDEAVLLDQLPELTVEMFTWPGLLERADQVLTDAGLAAGDVPHRTARPALAAGRHRTNDAHRRGRPGSSRSAR